MAEDFVDQCARSIRDGAEHDVLLRRADDASYRGSTVGVGGMEMLNFGSCSYMALERREELRRGVIDAVTTYGTQFPFAKPQLECPLYRDLEDALRAMTGGEIVVASSATLLHLAAVPALMRPGDAVVVDRLAHASLWMALGQLANVPRDMVPHNDVAALERKIAELSDRHTRVWYVLDGVYSMSGDFAPTTAIERLVAKFPKLHLYADDAHATSWIGRHGRGVTLDRIADTSRSFVTLSLNKAFSAAGGALVVPNADWRDRIRHAGAAMMFSGPIQPPMLGAAVASARLHLTAEFAELQRELQRRIARMRRLARERGIAVGTPHETPIVFIPCGEEASMYALFHALGRRGFYLAPAIFPAVGVRKAGLRLTVSLHNEDADMVRLLDVMREEMNRIPAIVDHQAAMAAE